LDIFRFEVFFFFLERLWCHGSWHSGGCDSAIVQVSVINTSFALSLFQFQPI
jgi:hypothetical protein